MKIYLEVKIPDDVTDEQDKIDIALQEIAAGNFKVASPCKRFVALTVEHGEIEYVYGTYNSYKEALQAFREEICSAYEDELAEAKRDGNISWIEEVEERIAYVRNNLVVFPLPYDLSDISEWNGNLCEIIEIK